jgi:fructoselysine-6-P-deglycase FrlB-like protein
VVSTKTLPLSPIDADFAEKTAATVALFDQTDQFAAKLCADGLKNIYFVGAGGSLICSYPAYYLLYRSIETPCYQVQSDEFNAGKPAPMGPGSLVVLASYTGTTKETVAAAKLAKEAGATVFAAAKPATPLAKEADLALEGASDILEYMLAYTLAARLGAQIDLAAVKQAFLAYPAALLSAVEQSEPHLHDIALSLKDEPNTMVLGSGPSSGWAYGLAMCYLQEMQWMNACSFNAGEFFQGAFEVVVEDTAVILFLGEDASRPLAERAKRFLDTYTRKAWYVDVKDLELPGIEPEFRPMVSPIAIGRIVSRLAQHYEALRGHSLEQRRYMFRTVY